MCNDFWWGCACRLTPAYLVKVERSFLIDHRLKVKHFIQLHIIKRCIVVHAGGYRNVSRWTVQLPAHYWLQLLQQLEYSYIVPFELRVPACTLTSINKHFFLAGEENFWIWDYIVLLKRNLSDLQAYIASKLKASRWSNLNTACFQQFKVQDPTYKKISIFNCYSVSSTSLLFFIFQSTSKLL